MPILRVAGGVVSVRAEPRDESELVDEVRLGERLTLLGRDAGWVFVQAREDHYFGWVRWGRVEETDEVPASLVVAVNLAPVFASADERAEVRDRLAAGTWLSSATIERGMAVLPTGTGWVRETDLAPARSLPLRTPTPEDVLAAARSFLDVPYVWGGTSAAGIDCSGFVQLAYRLCGIVLTRDADQQATEGRLVEDPGRPGDLLFFGAPAVSHVAIRVDETRMIHAAGRPIGRVLEQPVAERGTPVTVRRYLLQ